jgi:hypothetical protein
VDDLMMVRELYGEVSPDPQLEANLRGQIDGLTMERGGGKSGLRRRIAPRRPAALGLGLVGAAAAAVVGIATLGGTSPTSSGHQVQAKPAELSARTILLAAAEKAAAEPVGRYWRVHTTSGQSYHVGRATGGYTVVGYTSEDSDWTARSDSDSDVLYSRDLGAHPLTAADQAAWKKAGSPSTWRVWSNDHYATLSSKPGASFGTGPGTWDQGDKTTPADKKQGAAEVRKMCARITKAPLPTTPASGAAATPRPIKSPGKFCQKSNFIALSWADRQKLASDPARFKELLFPDGALPNKPGLGGAGRLMSGFDFLTRQPASPEVRAAAFRLLATLPDVRSIGTVQDAKGRTGIGLAARATMREGSGTVFDEVLVLDPKTYQVLGEQDIVVKAGGSMRGMQPGTILSNQVVLEAGWTNDSPHHP